MKKEANHAPVSIRPLQDLGLESVPLVITIIIIEIIILTFS